MRGTKAKALRRAAAHYAARIAETTQGFSWETWHYTDREGIQRVGPCPRKLYQLAKRRYYSAKRGF